MTDDMGNPDIGRELGARGVEQVVSLVEGYCECEERRIAFRNHPHITALEAELGRLHDIEQDLVERIRRAPPRGDCRSRTRKAWYGRSVAGILAAAGFFLSLVALAPYRLGWMSYLVCAGIAVIVPFSLDRFLDAWGSARLLKALTAVTLMASAGSLVLLASIRGNVLVEAVRDTRPAVVFEEGSPEPAAPRPTFYEETVGLLRVVMALLSLGMELACGLAVYDARRYGAVSGEDPDTLDSRLQGTRREMIARLAELTAARKEPWLFAATFWRDFYRSMLTHTIRSAMKKLLMCALGLLLFLPPRSSAAVQTNLVILIDLTASVAGARGLDGKTELDKNIAGVSRVLAAAPAVASVTVVGITDRSFSAPYVLLSARLDPDAGYFQERLASAREQLVQAWRKRSRSLVSRFMRTDILGSLVLAAQLFEGRASRRNVLVIFSDMREETPALNLAAHPQVPVTSAIKKVEEDHLVAELTGVEVFALGVDAAGVSVRYWNSLRDFWTEYFVKAGANLRSYSQLRDSPELPH